jgi:hypothetical protein
LFTGAVGDLQGSTQEHDFEPGIAPSGLFWTIAVPPEAVELSPGSGEARFEMEDVAVPDLHDFFNSVSPTPNPGPVPSHVSFEVQWLGGGERQKIRDGTFGFVGHFVSGEAHIEFSVSNDGGGEWSSIADGQTTVSAGVGHERNGRFFS